VYLLKVSLYLFIVSHVYYFQYRFVTNIFKSIIYISYLQATTEDEDLPKNLSFFITFENNGEQWYV